MLPAPSASARAIAAANAARAPPISSHLSTRRMIDPRHCNSVATQGRAAQRQGAISLRFPMSAGERALGALEQLVLAQAQTLGPRRVELLGGELGARGLCLALAPSRRDGRRLTR